MRKNMEKLKPGDICVIIGCSRNFDDIRNLCKTVVVKGSTPDPNYWKVSGENLYGAVDGILVIKRTWLMKILDGDSGKEIMYGGTPNNPRGHLAMA